VSFFLPHITYALELLDFAQTGKKKVKKIEAAATTLPRNISVHSVGLKKLEPVKGRYSSSFLLDSSIQQDALL